MYHILSHPNHRLPTLIKGTDYQYPNLIRAGYMCIHSGMKFHMEIKMEEIMGEIVGAMSQ